MIKSVWTSLFWTLYNLVLFYYFVLGYCTEPKERDNAVRTVPNTQYEVGTNVTYTCDECYEGGGTPTCQCNRTWSHPLECAIEHCIHPGTIQNGQVEGDPPFTCVSTLKYTCNQGYWLLGPETLRCEIDGQWDHGKPVCIDKSQGCGEPPKIDNAQRFGSVMEVMYQCDECYMGGGSATCWNGEWSHDGNCDMVPCDNVPDVQNGNRLPSKDSVTCGTKVRYTCNEGFTVEGASVLECVVGGELRGQVPVCKVPGVAVSGSGQTTDQETEQNNDALVFGLGATGFLLAGVIITLAAVFFCKRKGVGPCARFQPDQNTNQADQAYQQPNDFSQSTNVEENYNHYMELDDPKSPDYQNQASN